MSNFTKVKVQPRVNLLITTITNININIDMNNEPNFAQTFSVKGHKNAKWALCCSINLIFEIFIFYILYYKGAFYIDWHLLTYDGVHTYSILTLFIVIIIKEK